MHPSARPKPCEPREDLQPGSEDTIGFAVTAGRRKSNEARVPSATCNAPDERSVLLGSSCLGRARRLARAPGELTKSTRSVGPSVTTRCVTDLDTPLVYHADPLVFVETPVLARQVTELLTDEEYGQSDDRGGKSDSPQAL